MNDAGPQPIPRKVLLFSGHMIDAPGRKTPRFPASQEATARRAIVELLSQLDAGPQDLAVCSGACGGDLLFVEAARARAMPVEIHLPFDPATFVVESVDFAGADWHARFEAACAAASVHWPPPPQRDAPPGANPYELTNLWMLDAASRFGAGKVDFICLWDGRSGDGPGGTQHLMHAVNRRHGRSHRLDTHRLWNRRDA